MGRALRAILGFLRRRARATPGLRTGAAGRWLSCSVSAGALNLNVHLHALVLDGVFTHDGDAVDFHVNPSLDAGDVADVLATVEAHVTRLPAQRGEDAEDAGGGTVDPCAEDAPVLAGLAAAAVQGRVALGDRAGARVHQAGDPLAAAPGGPAARGVSRAPLWLRPACRVVCARRPAAPPGTALPVRSCGLRWRSGST